MRFWTGGPRFRPLDGVFTEAADGTSTRSRRRATSRSPGSLPPSAPASCGCCGGAGSSPSRRTTTLAIPSPRYPRARQHHERGGPGPQCLRSAGWGTGTSPVAAEAPRAHVPHRRHSEARHHHPPLRQITGSTEFGSPERVHVDHQRADLRCDVQSDRSGVVGRHLRRSAASDRDRDRHLAKQHDQQHQHDEQHQRHQQH